MSTTQSKQPASQAGSGQNGRQPDPLAEAIAHEEAIRQEAEEIRGEATELNPELFLKLWPLLRRPIPAGFIQHVGVVKGKPYESTGVKSLQVLIDRMNAVLTPLWWWYEVEYLGEGDDHGKLAEVTVCVGPDREQVLCSAVSRGGVNQASTIGNLFKGSETNAAKRAFAQIGPGHEVYLGATDLDPDVSEEAAEQQGRADRPPAVETIAADQVARLMEAFQAIPVKDEDDDKQLKRDLKLKLGSIGVSGSSVGQAFAKLTPAQAADVDGWLSEQADSRSQA